MILAFIFFHGEENYLKILLKCDFGVTFPLDMTGLGGELVVGCKGGHLRGKSPSETPRHLFFQDCFRSEFFPVNLSGLSPGESILETSNC